ncbi:glycosyltransferase [Microvirga lotononidis]|uniref:Putative glycosyl transferase n=1 Tax=Microvirga lotononidis TaxID=864069 RepID=I4YNL4_9HYPH|nr:glycosyltransferase [Microvirga lotononidis]EIM25556.1 putative glycosyl transferase [Microvirga lotononidis]WQO26136.1 glycosyltransferase [Microvirga lotononidis]
MSLRVLIAVTHLLGAGHLARAAALARAFAARGHAATLVSGGTPSRLAGLENVAFVQLPPVQTVGTDFKTLLGDNLAPVDEVYLDKRRALLLDTLRTARPDILITELFPFGRRVLADEFATLLDAARRMNPRPRVLCSIRDILVASSKASRVAETHERVLRDYDAVLVHGDPELVPLEASWPVDERVKPLVRYTGYVDENDAPMPLAHRHGIVVSGGSSAASLPLYRAALAAAQDIADRPWRLLVGRGVAEAEFLALRESAPAHVTVERARPDFRALLSGAEVSVSQAGYNTVVDLLRCGVPSILVPFEAGKETEQRLRAERLAALGLAEIVPEAELSPQHLAEAVRRGLARRPSPAPTISLDGADRTVIEAESLVSSGPALHRTIDWSPLDLALDRARDQGVPVRFWWRDDDAVADTPRLDRLLELARRYDAGIGLAVIPEKIQPSLARRLASEPKAFALVHGWSHADHAPDGEKKAEFGPHRPLDRMATEAERGLHLAREHLGSRLLPVFVPPWNRISPDLVPRLPGAGFRGLSTFTDRKSARPPPGLVQVNTHVDPIDWHGTRSLADPPLIMTALAGAVERRVTGDADSEEPIGFLTHHLVHDDVIWALCERLIARLAARGIGFLCPDAWFGLEIRSHLKSNGV